MKEYATAILLLTGAAVMLLAGIGVLRMPDLFTRMHAATKLPSLGMTLVFIGVAVHFAHIGITTRALLGAVFFYLTVPVAAHMIGRAAYIVGVPLWPGSVVDELRRRYRGR